MEAAECEAAMVKFTSIPNHFEYEVKNALLKFGAEFDVCF
jgi:hypothetical protein